MLKWEKEKNSEVNHVPANVKMKGDYKKPEQLQESEYVLALSEWFFQRTGQHLDLRNPKTFNEKCCTTTVWIMY